MAIDVTPLVGTSGKPRTSIEHRSPVEFTTPLGAACKPCFTE